MNIAKTTIALLAALLISTTLSTVALAGDSVTSGSSYLLKKALIDDATPYIDMRYRYENVDQDGFNKDANASTLRTKLGYKTGKLFDLSATVEIENVTYLGDDSFNNTINGKTTYPTVADPDSTEVNHAFLTYTGIKDTTLKVGRQPYNLDNQRFIGTVGWRQNDQTYDSAAIINTSLPDTTLVYSYVNNINRIFSDDHVLGNLDTNTHIINASYAGLPYGKVTAYGYLIDLKDTAVFGLSSKTFGLRFNGSHDCTHIEGLKWLYTAEFANQTDYGENPTNYNANYYHAVGGVGFKGLTAKIGYEELGSDNNGTIGFSTPLATGHKFNGWADKFLATPVAGLEDAYASVTYKISDVNDIVDGTKFSVIYHDFSAVTGGADYGSEWNALIARNFMKHYSVAIKYASYNADTISTDTEKLWLQLGVKF